MGKVKEILYGRRGSTAGEILKLEYMEPLNLTVDETAKKLKVAKSTISRIINGRCRLSKPLATKLAKAFATTPEYWMNFADNCTNPYPNLRAKGWYR
ncbi:putative transcriptional regulator [Erwinia phage vB_EamM_RAY]|jgi:addiction module HigA family antidote|uniref:Transcriptional regulator n=10 Tax=Agricanvirus TaxID=1984776 RepID=A0A173GED6_9CAUD|nr:plasmid antitoxin with HTH domain [Erwinia phage Ea35-70]YP_009605242.1 plasmid antitoxin with HTH domain [Erwinia phage vB_EamM_Deimos-Minion]YP_009605561.1 plasmid antitoxin with HTH domain [Erwinia phage vB_EamM_RAY]YP_009605881.1 plasmid antitoxin with HTH domain [Erwinia phage vB_EamM_Simmy50]YP_009606203.1 plasmid antitoxin with HTH domain [Erwinia phage vB_EamM_Special G]YP_009621835.1 plasmid antitoxin with HTH domain [Erwinia phage vB_EamM_Desertfox]AUG85882.1 putative transcripti